MQGNFDHAKHKDFNFEDSEVRSIFQYVTGTKNPAGVKIDVQSLIDTVFVSVQAYTLELIRKTLLRKDISLNKLF